MDKDQGAPVIQPIYAGAGGGFFDTISTGNDMARPPRDAERKLNTETFGATMLNDNRRFRQKGKGGGQGKGNGGDRNYNSGKGYQQQGRNNYNNNQGGRGGYNNNNQGGRGGGYQQQGGRGRGQGYQQRTYHSPADRQQRQAGGAQSQVRAGGPVVRQRQGGVRPGQPVVARR